MINRLDKAVQPIGAKAAARSAAVFSSGWYQVGFSHDVGPGQLKRVIYFGRTLVLFRTMSGVVAMLNGICGHYAHPLARGVVKGESIECPLHGWLWSTEGTVTRIPYSFSGGHYLKIKAWTLREVGNLIVVWYDPRDGRPDRSEPGELVIDRPVHSISSPEPITNRSPVDGSLLLRELRPDWPGRTPEWLPSGAESHVELETRAWGPGFHHTRLRAGALEVIELSAVTPVSREKVQHFSTVSVRAGDGGEQSARSILSALTAQLELTS